MLLSNGLASKHKVIQCDRKRVGSILSVSTLIVVATLVGCQSQDNTPTIGAKQLVPASDVSTTITNASGIGLSDSSDEQVTSQAPEPTSAEVEPTPPAEAETQINYATTLEPVDAMTQTTGETQFPLTVVAGSKALVGADGRPFLVLGDAAWSLIVELDRDEVDHYLENRKRLGFNAVLVSLIEHRFSSNPPYDAYGDAPFSTPGDFSTPNEAYFEHVDWVMQRMADYGFLVFLAPSYTGWIGGSDGWWEEMVDNGAETLRAYGRFVGGRYGHFDNIVWVEGGDGDPTQPDLVDAIAAGISETDLDALHTAHLAPDTPPREFWSQSAWLDIDNVYTYDPVYEAALEAYNATSMPYLLMESAYENEHDVSTRRLRTQAYHALFTGATGEIFGNNPIWNFGSGGLFDAPVTWQDALDGPGSQSMSAVAQVMKNIDWWDLRPDSASEFLTGGIGEGQDRSVAAVSDDGTWGVVYVPTKRTITLDFGQIGRSRVHVTWYDASLGTPAWEMTIDVDGVTELETPENTANGDDDWVIVVTVA